MTDTSKIKQSFERTSALFHARPGQAQPTCVTTARARDGLSCEIEEGPWKLTVDLPRAVGGGETGPSPGTLGRSALCGCLAIGYILRAAVLGVPIDGLEVELQADRDDRALFDAADAAETSYYRELRYIVRVTSDAPATDIQRVLDEADARSPYLDVFSRPQSLRREVQIRTTTEAAS